MSQIFSHCVTASHSPRWAVTAVKIKSVVGNLWHFEFFVQKLALSKLIQEPRKPHHLLNNSLVLFPISDNWDGPGEK